MRKDNGHLLFLKSTVSLFLIRLSLSLSNLFVFAFLSHRLSLADNGLYLSFYIRITMLSLIAGAGVSMVVYSYSITTLKYILKRLRKEHLSVYLFFVALMAAILVFLHFRETPQQLSFVYVTALVIYFLTFSANLIGDAVIIVGKREKWLVIVNIVYSIVFIGIHLAVFYSGYSLQNIISLLAILSSAKFVFSFSKMREIFMNTDAENAPVIHIIRIRKYFLHAFVFDLSQIIFRLVDKFLITLIVASGLSAVYINGTIDIPFVPIIFASICNTALIRLGRRQKNKPEQIIETLRFTSRLMSTIIFSVFFFFFVFRQPFIVIFFSGKYETSVPLFAISLFKLLSYLVTVSVLLQHRQQGKIMNIGAVIDICISVGLLYPLYQWLGLEGIILSFVAGTLIQTIFYTFRSAKLLRTNVSKLLPLENWFYKAILFSAVAYASYFLTVFTGNTLLRLCFGAIVIGGAGAIVLYVEIKRRGGIEAVVQKTP